MTKYVLNSGGQRNNIPSAKRFFAEVVKDLGERPRILYCFFAQKREEWETKFAEYVANAPNLLPEGIQPVFELAFPEIFIEQVKKADTIFIHGGDDHLLLYWLKQFDTPNIWKDKVIAASSAGSHALAKHFWTCDWRKCMDGLGILPIKFLAHFESEYGKDDPRGPIDWKRAYDELKNFSDTTLPIHALKEGEYVVIEK
jgi:peptidase E